MASESVLTSLDAQRILGKAKALKARLRTRMTELSALIEANAAGQAELDDLVLRRRSLEEELGRLRGAEERQAGKLPHPSILHAFDRSAPSESAREFVGHVAELATALEGLLGRMAENERIALKEQAALEAVHATRLRDAAAACALMRESADRMQVRVEKKAAQERIDIQETEALENLLAARKAELELYTARRDTLQREAARRGGGQSSTIPPLPSETMPQRLPSKDDESQSSIHQMPGGLHDYILYALKGTST